MAAHERLARIDEPSGTTAWTYDPHGDIVERLRAADGVALITVGT